MRTWQVAGLALLASMVVAPGVGAQVVPPPVPGAVPAAAPAPPTKNIFSMLLPSTEQCAKVKECIHNSPLGDMLKSMAKPAALATGGMIGGRCGTPSADDLKKLVEAGKDPDGAEGAAAKIKKSEAEAKARREAVRYLGTVDCNYWPEATLALIGALRGDPSECVRYEAALALARGCCCNKKTMEALKHSMNGDNKDDFPAETSERVRAVAAEALARCAAEYTEPAAVVPEKQEGLPREGSNRSPARPLARHVPPHGMGLFGILTGASANSPRLAASTQAAAAPQAAIQPAGMVVVPAAAPPTAAPSRGWVVLEDENMPPSPAAVRPK